MSNNKDEEPLELSLDDMLISDDLPAFDEIDEDEVKREATPAPASSVSLSADPDQQIPEALKDEATRHLVEAMKHELNTAFEQKLEKIIITQLPLLIGEITDKLMETLPEQIAAEVVPSLNHALSEKQGWLIDKSLMAIADQLGKEAT